MKNIKNLKNVKIPPLKEIDFKALIKKYMPAFILLVAILGALIFIATKPTAQRTPPPKIIPQIEAFAISKGTIPITVETVGTLVPSQQVSLKSQIIGTVESISLDFEPGAVVKKDTLLVALEQRDYANELKKNEASLAKAKASYQLEQGQQAIARTELEQLKNFIQSSESQTRAQQSLTLRKPQLEQAKADVAIEQANVDIAKLNLERTQIKAPFDALIVERNVSTGQNISTSEVIAELVAIDEYWADVAIPVDTLYNNELLSGPVKEIPVQIFSNFGEEWSGEVIQIVGALSSASRMGKMLVRIKDPLALDTDNNRTPLLMGDQVNIAIEAGVYDDVLAVPRGAVINNTTLWIVDENDVLVPVDVDMVWRDGSTAYIKDPGLANGTLIYVAGLSTPVVNLQVNPIVSNAPETEVVEVIADEQEDMPKRKGQGKRPQS